MSIRPYVPHYDSFPYTAADFKRQDESDDDDFYSSPRFVTHIDDNAIELLKAYYAKNLPRSGRILDMCSSWISHFPRELEEKAIRTRKQRAASESQEDLDDEACLEIIGQGMNAAEMSKNPILHAAVLQDLNTDPELPRNVAPLDATTCVVSIDYLTKPVRVLSSLLEHTRPGGKVHLTISNRCFPTKAVGRWLRVSEEERLQMVGDYLWFAGWRDIEICTLNDGKAEIGASSGMWDWFRGGRIRCGSSEGRSLLQRTDEGKKRYGRLIPLRTIRGRRLGTIKSSRSTTGYTRIRMLERPSGNLFGIFMYGYDKSTQLLEQQGNEP